MGDMLLVDKTPSYALHPDMLHRAEAYFEEPVYIHLLRHPADAIASFEEAGLEQIFFQPRHTFNARELAEMIWNVSHENIGQFLRSIPPQRQLQVRFEELVQQPHAVMPSIAAFLGVKFEEGMLEPYREKDKRMTNAIRPLTRMLGDVKFHGYGQIERAAADRWKTRGGVELSAITRNLAGRLGYETTKMFAVGMERKVLRIERTSREASLPLSYAQERLWFLNQIGPKSAVYNISAAVRIEGPLKLEALSAVLNEIIRRHEVLRTTFMTRAGGPEQVIHPCQWVELPLVTLEALSETGQAEEVKRLASAEAQSPFDLSIGPLMRVTLLRLGPMRHVLLYTMHHIVSDGWSMGVLAQECVRLYEAHSHSQPSPLAELPIQYVDYAVWQRGWLQGEVLETQLSYWKKQLQGAPALLELPTDRMRPEVQTYRGATQQVTLSKEMATKLRQLSRQNEVTLFMTLLAGFGVLLHRYTGQLDMVFGTPVANRNRAELEGLIGFFVNTVALRINFNSDPTFLNLLQHVRATTLAAQEHQDLPFEKLVEELRPQRNLGYSPLFQVMFDFQNVSARVGEQSDLVFQAMTIPQATAKFDLTLACVETMHEIIGVFEYNTELFDQQTIVRVADHYKYLLEQIVADPDQPLSAFSISSQAELSIQSILEKETVLNFD
jgi:hypothetical protein